MSKSDTHVPELLVALLKLAPLSALLLCPLDPQVLEQPAHVGQVVSVLCWCSF